MSEPRRPSDEDGRQFADVAWSVPGYLLSGMVLWGIPGWLLSWWTGWMVFKPIGLIIGASLAIYLVYWKYAR